MTPTFRGQQVFNRSDLVEGLRALVRDLNADANANAVSARIRIVGGAAIALTLRADRSATVDIDAPVEPAEPVLEAARRIAEHRNWRQDWLNDAAAAFLPTGYGSRSASWTTVHDDGQIVVQIATPETLLAMKLHAAQRRGNRDAIDLATLLPRCDVTCLAEAEELYGDYYPGDALTARTSQLVQRIRATSPTSPSAPPPIDLS